MIMSQTSLILVLKQTNKQIEIAQKHRWSVEWHQRCCRKWIIRAYHWTNTRPLAVHGPWHPSHCLSTSHPQLCNLQFLTSIIIRQSHKSKIFIDVPMMLYYLYPSKEKNFLTSLKSVCRNSDFGIRFILFYDYFIWTVYYFNLQKHCRKTAKCHFMLHFLLGHSKCQNMIFII